MIQRATKAMSVRKPNRRVSFSACPAMFLLISGGDFRLATTSAVEEILLDVGLNVSEKGTLRSLLRAAKPLTTQLFAALVFLSDTVFFGEMIAVLLESIETFLPLATVVFAPERKVQNSLSIFLVSVLCQVPWPSSRDAGRTRSWTGG